MPRVDDGRNSPEPRRRAQRRKLPRAPGIREDGTAEDPARVRQYAMNASLRLLSIRGRSRHELEVALRRRKVPEAIAADVIRRLGELGYLDDGKFAKDRALSLLRNGRLGARAVLQRLRAHGLSETEAKRALADAETELEFDPLATARAVLERRGLAGRPLTLKEKGKAARLLQSRGFPSSVVGALVGDAPFAPDDD